jgi:aminomethyltransferase
MSETIPPAISTPALARTPLYDAHVALGAKMVGFAGYEMPVQYPTGILAEHTWTREHASLFDISHMGQAVLTAADGRFETAAAALETMVPGDMASLAAGQQRYTQLTNDTGGVIDDLIAARPLSEDKPGTLNLVVNAARKAVDYAHITASLPAGVTLTPEPTLALLALQGPKAAGVVAALCPSAAALGFQRTAAATIAGLACHIARSGYTGEDGYEISVAASDVSALWASLIADDRVRPCGLGARDSLRLEAGLCLYGHELDETISPIEAGLAWSIAKRRRAGGGFPGAARIQAELANGPARLRVGILPDGRAPARDGTQIQSQDGTPIGVITSGGFSPTLKRPIAIGTVLAAYAKPGTRLALIVRGVRLDAAVVALPFVPHRYHR